MARNGDHRGMFKTTFRSTDGDGWLAGPVYLPTLPERGDPVRIRERANHSREQVGHVTNRTWLIVSKEPGESEAIVHVAVD